jgi:hypothetical protein
MAAAPLQSVAVSAPPPAGDAASQIVYGAQAVSAINLTAFRIGLVPMGCVEGQSEMKDKEDKNHDVIDFFYNI